MLQERTIAPSRIAVILAGSSLRCEANGSLLECERAAYGEIDRQLWAAFPQ